MEKDKNKKKNDYLPQSELEWLQTGKFYIEEIIINDLSIKCALTHTDKPKSLLALSGGIPRDKDRQKNLPLINKLYGKIAVDLLDRNVKSLLYNQPATGGSGGEWNKETLNSRIKTLSELIMYYCKNLGISEVSIVGSSAGAYMALRALDLISNSGILINSVILLSSAAYPQELEDIPYGEKFTKIVSSSWNIETSPAFKDLEKHSKNGTNFLISFFEVDDPPIPIKIQEYYKFVLNKSTKEEGKDSVVIIPNVSHNFNRLIKKKNQNIIDNSSVVTTAKKFVEFILE